MNWCSSYQILKADCIKLKRTVLQSFHLLLSVEIQCHLILLRFVKFHVCQNQLSPILLSFLWDTPVLKPHITLSKSNYWLCFVYGRDQQCLKPPPKLSPIRFLYSVTLLEDQPRCSSWWLELAINSLDKEFYCVLFVHSFYLPNASSVSWVL